MFKKILKNGEKFPIIAKHKETKQIKNTSYGSTIEQNQCNLQNELDVFPTAVLYVLFSKTFESVAANGIRSVLSLYLRDSLNFSENFSTEVLHTFNFVSQFLPIFGAILADSYLGNVNTIFYFCVPYLIGYVMIFLATLPYLFSIHSIIYTSLLFIAIGNGTLRACITSLGAHQFILPQQQASLDRYFAAYYFFYYAGILMGKILPPYVRTTLLVTPFCVDIGECYTSVFGVITLAFIISWVIFLCGLSKYRPETPTRDNTLLKTLKCVTHSVCQKFKRNSSDEEGKYSKEFLNDVKIFLKIVKLFLPLPIYYSLLVQQDSTFTFQATMTDTNIFGIDIPADQFKSIGPILLLLLIPLWQKVIYPLLQRCEIHLTSLECVFIGGLFAALSFVCAGFLQHYIVLNERKSLSILWQFPQFLFIMIAEMLISVPGLKFAYTCAPNSMKSVLTAIFFINNAMGNLIVVIFTQMNIFGNKTYEYFFYAFLMILATIVVKLLSSNHELDSKINNDEQTIEAYIFVDEIQSTNLEENFPFYNEKVIV